MNLSTIDRLVLQQALLAVVANGVSKLSIMNASGGVSFRIFYLLCPGGASFGFGFIPVPSTIVLSWGFNYFVGLGGM